ncbi:MAG: DUF2235 domain-containing protein [Candidatus Marinimicrobia bacterium]|nr:DUF2235 domain-containing protein [Candidatus Neomarinimicrobiota bacterium]
MKNIVVFSDGTGQDGGTENNTNVYKLFNIILDRSDKQISFYDPGVGTGFKKFSGNVGGRGLGENVRECYRFIVQEYKHGDKLFLFGFSRGAATVRSLAGFIHFFGILPRSRVELIDRAWEKYKIRNHNKRKNEINEFKEFNHSMRAEIQFLGVWDTVTALGVPNTFLDKGLDRIIPHDFHDLKLSDIILNAYHALSIDDPRRTFHPSLFDTPKNAGHNNPKQNRKQVWFAGVHTDVGGGYKDKGLSDITLEWMVQNAVEHGLLLYIDPKEPFKRKCDPNIDGKIHNPVDNFWKRLIFKKKERKWESTTEKPIIHQSVLDRMISAESKGYDPWIAKLNHDIEPMVSSKDVITQPAFKILDPVTLSVLKNW